MTRCFRFMALSVLRTTRRISPFLGALVLTAAMIGLSPATTLAQEPPPKEFQLDGTAAVNGSYPACDYGTPCDYWDLINGTGTGDGSDGHSFVRRFINGEGSTEAFAGGGSKDPNTLDQWACKSSPTPNKDTLTNGYAAAYIASATSSAPGDLVLSFGADRLSTSGDANIGIWFFHEDVTCDSSTGQFVVAGTNPPVLASHEPHDILVVSSFTTGGTTPIISVYEWDTSCTSADHSKPLVAGDCAAENLKLKFSEGSLCDNSGSLSTLAACAITNSADIPVTWPYPTLTTAPTSTSPSMWTVPAQAFFTGGADVTNLIGGGTCFASFLEDTRTSQSPTSTLKDFLVGSFPVCGMRATKTCTGSSIDSGGTSVTYNFAGTLKNTGAASLSSLSIQDVPNTDGTDCSVTALNGPYTSPSGTGTPDCTSLASGETCYYHGNVQCTFNSSTFDNEVTVSGTPSGSTTPITATASWLTGTGSSKTNGCAATVSGALSLGKSCSTLITNGSPLTVAVAVSGSITNNANVAVSNITITDDPATTLSITCGATKCTGSTNGSFSLEPGGTATYSGTLTGSSVSCTVLGTNGTDAGRCKYSDSVTASGTGALSTGTIGSGPAVTASCYLCEGSTECK